MVGRRILTVICFSAGVALAGSQPLDGNPYAKIVVRNIFGLKPPIPPQSTEPKSPPAKLILTGITTILGNKRALISAIPPARGGQSSKEEFYMLCEGQREGGIEVREINEKAGSVRVDGYGAEVTLTFDKDGAKPSGGSAITGNSASPPIYTPYNPAPVAPSGLGRISMASGRFGGRASNGAGPGYGDPEPPGGLGTLVRDARG